MVHIKVLVAKDTSTTPLCTKRHPATRAHGRRRTSLGRIEADNGPGSYSLVTWIGMADDLIPPMVPPTADQRPEPRIHPWYSWLMHPFGVFRT